MCMPPVYSPAKPRYFLVILTPTASLDSELCCILATLVWTTNTTGRLRIILDLTLGARSQRNSRTPEIVLVRASSEQPGLSPVWMSLRSEGAIGSDEHLEVAINLPGRPAVQDLSEIARMMCSKSHYRETTMFDIPVGIVGTKSLVVTKDVTVAREDERMPAVFATPMMICLMEVTAGDLIQRYLPEGWITVGAVVNVRHLAATPVGATVTARAEVTEVGKNTITFAVEAHDGVEKIGEGTHVRAPVEVARFLKRVEAKSVQSPGS